MWYHTWYNWYISITCHMMYHVFSDPGTSLKWGRGGREVGVTRINPICSCVEIVAACCESYWGHFLHPPPSQGSWFQKSFCSKHDTLYYCQCLNNVMWLGYWLSNDISWSVIVSCFIVMKLHQMISNFLMVMYQLLDHVTNKHAYFAIWINIYNYFLLHISRALCNPLSFIKEGLYLRWHRSYMVEVIIFEISIYIYIFRLEPCYRRTLLLYF